MNSALHRTAWTLAAGAVFLAVARFASSAAPSPRHRVVLWTFGDDAARPGYLDAVKALGSDAAVAGGACASPANASEARSARPSDQASASGTPITSS